MNIVPYQAEHLLALNLQRGQGHCVPFITERYAKDLESTEAFTGLVDGKPVAVGGVWPLWTNRAIVWSFVDAQAGPHFFKIHKAAKRFFDTLPYARLEADTPVGFEEGCRWLKLLGFSLETPCAKAYYPDGTDAVLYARVKP